MQNPLSESANPYSHSFANGMLSLAAAFSVYFAILEGPEHIAKVFKDESTRTEVRQYLEGWTQPLMKYPVNLAAAIVLFGVFWLLSSHTLARLLKEVASLRDTIGKTGESQGRIVALEEERDGLQARLLAYEVFGMVLDNPQAEYDQTTAMWAARMDVSHTGKRSAVSKVDIVGLAFIGNKDDSQLAGLIQSYLPISLCLKHSDDPNFEIHSESPRVVDVAYLERPDPHVKIPRIIFGPIKRFPSVVDGGDYIAVLRASGHHAATVHVAATVGDQEFVPVNPKDPNRRLVIKLLPKSIGEVLGDDHPLAKEFDQKIVRPHPRAS